MLYCGVRVNNIVKECGIIMVDQQISEVLPQSEASAVRNARLGRTVLSFVRRSGRLDARLQRAYERYCKQYLLNVTQGEGSLRLREDLRISAAWIKQQWGNDHPLVIEIGSGQGENIVAACLAHPELNFLALEVYDPGVAHTMLLAGKESLTNLRIAQVNAPDLLSACDERVVKEIWTFFPDPWPKKRHHKRRIVQDGLAQAVAKALCEGGVWRIATDIEDYALHVHEVLDHRDDFDNIGTLKVSLPIEHVGKGNVSDALDLPHADFYESERFSGRVLTNFEQKGLRASRRIHDLTYRVR